MEGCFLLKCFTSLLFFKYHPYLLSFWFFEDFFACCQIFWRTVVRLADCSWENLTAISSWWRDCSFNFEISSAFSTFKIASTASKECSKSANDRKTLIQRWCYYGLVTIQWLILKFRRNKLHRITHRPPWYRYFTHFEQGFSTVLLVSEHGTFW